MTLSHDVYDTSQFCHVSLLTDCPEFWLLDENFKLLASATIVSKKKILT